MSPRQTQSMARLHLLAESRTELKDIFEKEWGIDPTAPGKRFARIALLDAWETAKTRVDEERRQAAEARAAGLVPALGKAAHLALRSAVETRFEEELADRIVPHSGLVDQVLAMVEESHV